MSVDEEMAVVPSAEGSRLVIKEMVLENFKSYAGEQRVGPFHKNFSSVVGPNGSGKSNVIDAMLFVFGKRAKQLRLNKVSELIHNSTHHQDVPMARVSVHFVEIIDKGDHEFETVPGSELVVARTAHADNKSDYFVDGRKRSFGAVTALLKGKGIDLDNNRFLILQGEVEQISLMKPRGADKTDTGLLEYLEDIIGTDKYVEAIEEQGKRLEELSDSLSGLRQRAKAAEDERDRLEGPKEVALAYQAKERELLAKEAAIYTIFMYDGKKTLVKLDSNVEKLGERLQYETQKLANYTKDLKEAEARFKESDRVRAADQAELDAAAAEITEFERRDVKYKEDRRHCKAKLKKAEEKLAKDAARLQELEAEAQKLQVEIPAIGEKTERLTAELAKQEQVLDDLRDGIKGEVEALTRQLQKVRAELAPWEARINAARSAADVAGAERDLLLQQQEAAQTRLREAEEGRTSAGEAAAAKDGDVIQMERRMKMLRGEAELAQQQQTAASAEAERLQAAVADVRGRVEQRRGEAGSRRSAGAIVDALVAAREAGTLPGVHGRLGDLGAIDPKYDVAVSSAVGALDFIVVDTTVTAQKCVELLRKQKLGVATFLILEKQQHLAAQMGKAASPPEGVPRLFDLVKLRDRSLGVAFYYAMRDTVVAADLEQASRVAYGADRRWAKVVTLKGELINESGTMTGGGGRPRAGRMCLGSAAPRRQGDDREDASELAAAEKQLAADLKALEKARTDAAEAGTAVKAAERQLAELERGVVKARMEAKSLRERAQDLADRLAELRAATKLSAEETKRLKALAVEITAAEAELADLRQSASGLQAKADALLAAIEGAGGDEMRNQKALVDQMRKDIAAKDAEKARAVVKAAAAAKAAAKLRADGVRGEAERERLAAELEGMKAKFEELETMALRVMEAQQATQARLDARGEQMAGVSAEYERKKVEVGAIQSVQVDIENEMKDQRETRRNEERKLRHWHKETAKKREQIAAAFADGEAPAQFTEEELDAMDTAKEATEIQYQVTMLSEELKLASPDLDAIERWRAKEAECSRRVADLDGVRGERETVRRRHDELRKARLDGFMAGFNAISLKLKEMYQMITLGGDAELELVDSLDPFSEGIVFSVRPPKKSWKNIANLSGGEKTLSSLSLVFALHHYKPTPLYVMDEIDAALDFKNVSIVAHYIKERTKDAQFIIISLRNNMFELADRLVGIYKTDNATKSLAINPGEFVIGRPKGQPQCESAQGMMQSPLQTRDSNVKV